MTSTSKPPLRLEYLDGLRALAALYVLLFHAALGFTTRPGPEWLKVVQRGLSYGHDAVAVFIVLSGYCLMLPVARAEGRISRGLASYFARRAWRILPPYFATLLASWLLLVVAPVLQTPTGTIWDDTSPAFSFGSVSSHLLLFHNWFPAWAHTVDGPLWSVATEWQIYFFFPLLLLPVWRRAGGLAAVLVGFVLGSSLLWFAPGTARTANSWYLGLFALGMAAAGINFASRSFERGLRERVAWGYVSASTLVVLAVFATVFVQTWFRWMPVSDAAVGLTTACGLVYLTRHAMDPAAPRRSLALRLLESAPLVALGRRSYSLYLTHLPVVASCYFAIRPFALEPAREWLLLLALGVPASLLFGYGFFWLFERRFVGSPALLVGKRAA